MCLGASSLLAACATSAAQAPLSKPSTVAQQAVTGELSEVARFVDHGVPKDVIIWLRVPAPGRDVPLLTTLLGVGSMFDPTQVLEHRLGATLSRTVDLSKPIDLTTSGLGEGPTRMVIAASVFDSDTFLGQVSQKFQLVHESQGRWRLEPKEKRTGNQLECELWHAAKPVGARLICATQPQLIGQQAEFLMAAARTEVDRANFHAEVPGSALQAVLLRAAENQAHKQGAPRSEESNSDRSTREWGQRMVTDWAHDVDGLSWNLTLKRNSVELSQEFGFARSESLLSTSLVGRVGPVRPVPDAFWQLPSDCDAALYSEGAEPERIRRQAATWIHQLRTLADADDDDELPPAMLDQMEKGVGSLLLRGGAFEFAYGRDLDRAARALNEAAERASDRGPRSGSADPVLKKAQTQLGGWILVGIEDDSSAYLQALRELLHQAADKTKYRKKKAGKPSPPLPSNLDFRELPLPKSAGLPSDTLHLVVRFEPNPRYVASKAKPAAPAPSAHHVLVATDGAQHLWLSLAADEALAMDRLRALLRPDPAKTLGASVELRQLAKQPVSGLGFGTLAAVNAFGVSADSKSKVLASQSTLKELWGLPKQGRTRMPVWITRARSDAGRQQVAFNVRLTPDAIGDLLAIFLASDSEPVDDESD